MTFNILFEDTPEGCVGHCLELDIVADAPTLDEAKRDMIDLIKAQLTFAFENGNLDHFFHPAPPEVWEKFYSCRDAMPPESYRLDRAPEEPFIPPWITANLCHSGRECHHA